MKNRLFIAIAFFVLTTGNCIAGMQWSEERSSHFIVYYTGDKGFATDVLKEAEGYYQELCDLLGYVRYSGFWTWENRAKIYIYPTQDDYLTYTKSPPWSGGNAIYTRRLINSYRWSRGFQKELLPHELSHIIFREFVGGRRNIPLWLDEGIAGYMEKDYGRLHKENGVKLFRQGRDLDFDTFNQMKPAEIKDAGKVEIFYSQALSVVGFMAEGYGRESFTAFLKQLRDGKDIDEALRFAYPKEIRNISELRQRWLDYLQH